MGIDPDGDVKWIAVGNGVPAGVALDRGAIDALAYYDTGFGQIEAAGIGMEFLPRPKQLPMVGGQFPDGQEGNAERQPCAADRLRSLGMQGLPILLADPAAGARAFLEMYPETAPRGRQHEDAVKRFLQQSAAASGCTKSPYPNTKMGFINVQEFKTEAELNQLKISDYSAFYTNELIGLDQ